MKSNTVKKLCLVHSLLFFLLFAFQNKSYAGQTFYISTTGSNSSSGSFNTPWRTLEYAITVARAGDTIIMRGGTYFMNEVFIDRKKGRGGADAVSCKVERPDKCRGISCGDFDFCLDAADTNGDFRIDSEDSGMCVVEDGGPLAIAIDSPASRSVTSDESIVVSGEVSRSAVSVAVNGVEAAIGGSAFAVLVPLFEGTNTSQLEVGSSI